MRCAFTSGPRDATGEANKNGKKKAASGRPTTSGRRRTRPPTWLGSLRERPRPAEEDGPRPLHDPARLSNDSCFADAAIAPRLTESKTVCSVSSHNTLAFTSSSDVQEPVGKITCFHVFVVDLNMPWEAHKVMTHSEEITCVEWDVGASKLLITDAVGQIQLWSMKSYLLNDWTMIASTSFPGEYILTGAWFHNGKKIGLNMEKKDSVQYLEKYVHVRFGPSVRQVGGKPSEGCIAVTSSGLVCVVILQSDETVITGTEILGLYRSRLKVVDLCYGKNKCIITCHPFSSFYLKCHATAQSREKPPHTRVTHLNFVLREAADAVAVSVSGSAGSTIELWELREKPVRFHKMFHTPAVDTVTKTVGWQHHESATYTSPVMALCTPRLSIYDMSPPPSYIIAAYKDNVIKCFSSCQLKVLHGKCALCSTHLNATALFRHKPQSIKYQHLNATVSHMQLSWTSSVMVAIDSLSQIYLFRLAPVTEPSTPVSPSYTMTLLEHCLMTGTDWWDVLLSMRPAVMGSREVISNLDKVLLHLETKEFSVEPLILQSLQQLTQWVADLTLYLMASLPQQVYNNMRFPGGGLISDAKSLNMLRELLVIFRMWGFISESCLPSYTKMTDNLDVLSLLFKLLTKTLLNHGSEPDETLLASLIKGISQSSSMPATSKLTGKRLLWGTANQDLCSTVMSAGATAEGGIVQEFSDTYLRGGKINARLAIWKGLATKPRQPCSQRLTRTGQALALAGKQGAKGKGTFVYRKVLC
ncbi:hypothetical protein HPB51_011725 [Rhipicephalus microplus]|uniref:Mediator of RNA polymerase II transcription subunit 16 n=1 Tax=Rhipicephalus microplus TaxID=6941 RepID=A0A9J6DN70_RHIMP|nr:hypothetical protein HPB51_011725 [Rhipicephalus microplus]